MTEKKTKTSKEKKEEIKRLDDLIQLLETENEALDKVLKGLTDGKGETKAGDEKEKI